MIEQIEEFEKRGFRISIFPSKEKSLWLWTAGVYIGDDTKAVWIDNRKNSEYPKAKYPTYREAFEACINYCNKPKRGK